MEQFQLYIQEMQYSILLENIQIYKKKKIW